MPSLPASSRARSPEAPTPLFFARTVSSSSSSFAARRPAAREEPREGGVRETFVKSFADSADRCRIGPSGPGWSELKLEINVEPPMANEQSVVARILVWFEGAWQDVLYACRMLVANPGFTSVAILSLAVGIGANCAIFSFADALLLRPLPVLRPGELLTIGSKQAVEAFGASGMSSSYRDYIDLRERTKSFASI